MGTNIEILKNNVWQKLQLSNRGVVKYNAVINKIGNIYTREIGHSNTFSIPTTQNNLNILGINFFNAKSTAKSLNKKYPAKYYIENRLTQTGFVVINNMEDDVINLNFIDKSLGIVESWGATTFYDLLKSTSITKPADYQTVIDEMVSYDMNKDSVLQPIPQVGSRGYSLSLFPNSLNTIGDGFQINIDGVRADDSFNPYQSRPVFNVKAIFDLATESFGYTPIYDTTVDWESLSKKYIVKEDLDDDELEDGGLISETYTLSDTSKVYVGKRSRASTVSVIFENQTSILLNYEDFVPSNLTYMKPNDIPNLNADTLEDRLKFDRFQWGFPSALNRDYLTQSTVVVPDGDTGNLEINMDFNVEDETSSITREVIIIFIWEANSPSDPPIIENFDEVRNRVQNNVPEVTRDGIDIKIDIDKAFFQLPPNGASGIIGVMVGQTFRVVEDPLDEAIFTLSSSLITEDKLPTGTVSYDDSGQYIADIIDLTHAAPKKSLKKILSSIMQYAGILISIDSKKKEVLFFNYAIYRSKVNEGRFADWSDFILKYENIKFNTNFGNTYGQINKIGLKDAYEGNTYNYTLDGQGGENKYKEYAENFNKELSDISNAKKINNTNNPYIEYSTDKLSLVSFDRDIVGLGQVRYNKNPQGGIPYTPHLANVNYLTIPNGVKEWYDIVNTSIRVEASFLLPLQEIINIKLYEPVYIEQLGGFFIIEEVSEYVNSSSPVNVKLIKLIL